MTKRELEVLNILFSTPDPMTVSEIVLMKTDLTQSTVSAVLRVLVDMKLVTVVGTTRCGKVFSRMYTPASEAKAFVMDYFRDVCSLMDNILSYDEICILAKERLC